MPHNIVCRLQPAAEDIINPRGGFETREDTMRLS